MVEEDHIAFCTQTGAPLKYGDPYVLQRPTLIQKNHHLKNISLEHRLMSNIKTFTPRYNPLTLEGEYVKTITENEFTNYLLPKYIQ
jgi:hypothetical protein